jgi:hypothetical protein
MVIPVNKNKIFTQFIAAEKKILNSAAAIPISKLIAYAPFNFIIPLGGNPPL